ncbi:uncharacterized protein LOC128741654 isoform X2 [Sabethes cyaneus]|uniref:uncharacterized protein LOC128741654 isoform X2 n=1 Tax=Sabethes cyaneus TaxID=53552 RepID=UPI00237E6C9C|nr:uncharacterized protein LOC128741654 isoform X2 [Sabethes cyaneus]
MSHKRRSLSVEKNVSNDSFSIQRKIWHAVVDAVVGRLRSRFSAGYTDGDVRSVPETGVFKCTRHYQTVVEEQLKLYFNQILNIFRVIGGWFVLKERKRKLNQMHVEAIQFPELNQPSTGEPARKYCKIRDQDTRTVVDVRKTDHDSNEANEVNTTVAYCLQEDPNAEDQQLSGIPKKKRCWDKPCVPQCVEKFEDQSTKLNELSQKKVENWLADNFPGVEQTNPQAPKMAMCELNRNCDEIKLQLEQNMAVSNNDDEDSLLSVDTAKYILSNRNKSNNINKVRATTTIQQFALASNRTTNAKLSLINLNRNVTKTPPLAMYKESRGEKSSAMYKQHVSTSRYSTPEKDRTRKRRKVFKKTEYEKSLQKKYHVTKISPMKSAGKQMQWIESNLPKSTGTSSSEDETLVRKQPRRTRRRRSVTQKALKGDASPCRKSGSSEWFEESLESIASSHEDTMPHSSKINNSNLNTTRNSSICRSNSIYDPARSILVYVPRQIEPSLPSSDRIRVTVKDLDLSQVTKPHHLQEFQKFNYLIHPNSTVRFYPSDSDDDFPKPALSAKLLQMIAEDSESFDEDDPILVYNPRTLNRLNLREIPYNNDC